MSNSPMSVVRACLKAYVDKDRPAIEALLDEHYHFTSPLDNRIDRALYLQLCWPSSEFLTAFEEIHEAERGEQAFIVYEARTSAGKRFRNAEIHTVRDGRLLETEVYFGWDLPHRVPAGTHADSKRF